MQVTVHDCPVVKDLVHHGTDERGEMTLCDYEQAGGNLRRLQADAAEFGDLDLYYKIEQHTTSLTIDRYKIIAARLTEVDEARSKLHNAEEERAAAVDGGIDCGLRVVDIAEILDISRWSVYRLAARAKDSGHSIDSDLFDIELYAHKVGVAESELWDRIAAAMDAGATYNDLRVVSGHTAETIRSRLRRRRSKEKDDPD